MKFRNTIILLLLAVGLFAFVHFYLDKIPTTREQNERAPYLVHFNRDTIDGITITNKEDRIEMHKQDGKWQMTAPIKDRVDENALTTLFSSLETLRKETTLDEQSGGKPDLKELGVASPSMRLKLSGTDAPPEILFGKDTAIEHRQYVRLDNSNVVYVIPDDLKNQITKKADDFRDRRLTDWSASQVTKVQIKTAAGEIELQKTRDHWEITKPLKARGDDSRINDLVAQTLNAHIDSFVSGDQTNTAGTALNDPRGSVTFYAEGNNTPAVLEVSKPVEKEKVYAKLSTRNSIYTLPQTVAAILDVKPNDLRDKHLVRLNPDTIDRIHLIAKSEIVLARKGEGWTIKNLNDTPADTAEVQRIFNEFQNSEVGFVSDTATDLPKYGLDHPQLKVTFAAYASENTAESKAGEQPFATVSLGRVDGDNVYAKLDDEPFVVSAPKSVVNVIHTDPLIWQELGIYKGQAAEIVSIEVTHAGRQPLAFSHEKEEWKLTKGEGSIDTKNVQSLANTIANLRAVRWAGAARPEQGIDKPAVLVKFTTRDSKGAGQEHTLRVGALDSASDLYYANADGHQGTFMVSHGNFDAINASLTQSVLPSPGPGSSAPPKH